MEYNVRIWCFFFSLSVAFFNASLMLSQVYIDALLFPTLIFYIVKLY